MEDQLIEILKDRISGKDKFIIGIGGFGGSGKTTLAEKLKKNLETSIIVQLDDFYSPELGAADLKRVLEQVLIPLSENKNTTYQIYDWRNEKMGEWKKLDSNGVIILEGVTVLHPDFLPYVDFKIWIDYPQELGFARGVKRDIEKDGVDNTEKWKKIWMPQEKEYVGKQNPKQYADIVIWYTSGMKISVQKLTPDQKDKIKQNLKFVKDLTQVGKEMELRIIIHGGYATDASVGQTTRPHDDVDIQIYGTEKDAHKVVNKLINRVLIQQNAKGDFEIVDKHRNEWSHNLLVRLPGSVLDIYYLQTKTSPLGKEKLIVKEDGSVSEQEFEELFGKIGDLSFEIQDPVTEAADKIYKREYRGDPKFPKHEQDIQNLKSIVSEEDIDKRLKERYLK